MNDNSTRKQFFSKLLGVATVAGVLPKVLAKSTASTSGSPVLSPAKQATVAFEIRHDTRAVARREVI